MRRLPQGFLVSAVLILLLLVFRDPVRHAAFGIIRFPFALLKRSVAVLITLPRLPDLSQENAALQADLTQQRLLLAQLQEAARRAQQTQTLQALAPSSGGVVASVIGRSGVPTQHTLLLDKGRRHGLTLESAVLDAEGLVGRVVELHEATCLVMLLTDPESRVAGLVERSRESGLLVGQGRGSCEFMYLDIEADIQEGDRILTAGLGGPFPKGLRLGTVVRVHRDEQAGTTSAWVKPSAHLNRAEEVLCLQSVSGR
jgi:rod shape-determining protein MreC